MSKGSKAKRQRTAKLRADWEGWLDEFQKEGDRAAIILGAAFLDERLHEVLGFFFVDDETQSNALLGVDGPLGAFGARVTAAYCLGFLSPADFADLRTIKQIRNDFAHMLHGMSFEDPEVKKQCLRLQATTGVLGGELAQNPRQVFLVSVVLIAHRVGIAAFAAKAQQRKVGPPYKPARLVLDPRHLSAGGREAGERAGG